MYGQGRELRLRPVEQGGHWLFGAGAASIGCMKKGSSFRLALLAFTLMRPGVAAAHVVSGPAAALRAFAGATRNAFGFTQGTGTLIVYVYFDPNCIYCHELYDRLQPYLRSGKLSVTWIPVGFLKRSSVGKAEAILAAPDPVRALAQNERLFDRAREEGAIAPAVNPATAVAAAVYFNTRLLARSGELATPTLVLAEKGQGIRVIPGMPAHLATLVGHLVPLSMHATP